MQIISEADLPSEGVGWKVRDFPIEERKSYIMKNLVKVLNRFIVVSYDIIKNLAGAVLVATIMIVTIGIISRYFFNHALSWIEEISCLLLIWLCYLSASLATVTKEHVVADFLSSSLPDKLKRILKTIIRICEIIFFGVVTYSVSVLIPSLTNVSAALQLPRLWYYMPVLVFGMYMVLVIAVDLINDFVPGYDFFGQRKARREAGLAELERQENEAMLKRVDEFMGI